ncbi:histidine--tRNA ligase [Taylorella equigenitalis]|uniref:histidine--tRNA ligase n=1 Tax=Taylorella equigenitalis TaxID=29575 RepID=UPI000416421C|nr:histidine--tRNA ligase [Taylorella equigenitalis]ASY30626.1 histidine--tRNA ligase [Taylorella equigenitalis]WDU47304.1 histidine--tRNA ligase [Taylorella equigenitalis]WDU52806.1 histidine--tRNA ligase [Taylorella equigenitalis]WDU54263.1 histidine--tRNA ligase [Taylorella equigenitalis]
MNSKKYEKISAIRGMNDILPTESFQWLILEDMLHSLMKSYGYKNIRTPVLEQTRLFARGIGEVTDIVEKEMYTFSMSQDKADMLTMRPEFTAGVVRAAIEHSITFDRAQRLYTMGPVFRHERPQKGRYRQFHQLSVEAMGFSGPDVDAEQIIMLARLWGAFGLEDIHLEINSLGQPNERLAHREALIKHLEANIDVLDDDAKRRMYSNPLRVLDTKNPDMQSMANEAPKLFDYLGEESKAHFDELKIRLDEAGIKYRINPRLVRGLDYYNLTVFEWVTGSLGAQATVCGGGRYDGLFELLGGKPTPCVGFAIGLERLISLIISDSKNAEIKSKFTDIGQETQVYFIHQNSEAARKCSKLAELCRNSGIDVIVHAGSQNFKNQFKRADFSGANYAIIIGESELQNDTVSLKQLRPNPDGSSIEQITIPSSDVVVNLLKLINKKDA